MAHKPTASAMHQAHVTLFVASTIAQQIAGMRSTRARNLIEWRRLHPMTTLSKETQNANRVLAALQSLGKATRGEIAEFLGDLSLPTVKHSVTRLMREGRVREIYRGSNNRARSLEVAR